MSQKSSTSAFDYDLVVIGSGPGGHEAALRAAGEGLRVCIVEKGPLGGVCVNWGCIPTKALLRSAEVFRLAGDASTFGLDISSASVDHARAVKRSRKVSLLMSKGVESSLKKNGVEILRGEASLVDEHHVKVVSDSSTDRVSARSVIVAAGGRSREIPSLPVDRRSIVTSHEALAMKTPPRTLLVIGGGAIGLEMAWYYQAAGSEVTVIEMMPRILPQEDRDISAGLEKALKKLGINVLCGAGVEKASVDDSGMVSAAVKSADGSQTVLEADCMLVAVGVSPNTEGLNLEEVGVELDRGFIRTDHQCRTAVENIFAIGDVRGGMLLAHKASAEAVQVVNLLAGREAEGVDETRIPRCVYTEPAVASVGLTEEQARREGHDPLVGRALFAASGKASAYGVRDGFVKLLFDRESGALLGGHVLGHGAVELIGELTLARELEVTARQLARAVHAHPTLSESVREAAEDALSGAG
ncbi:dihydrolipoyl dehydrogenase [Prosthecochloris sp. N3]|uniref:Dihydrolipoyl dehydrogenase n=1 Tax=Prosthecochloris ethylica TaxID=2743976 RepID=A0ABR9XQC3_9CHLB|nr:dihydrolipoyl dehydrogenase [Prosthecochloris ethylica]MBF0585442.1 dihydrolipoyl dehydrogenase [Prosthecochloris ethylica]MBF0636228.1 dihydrolipoyl dehydrogenase [Prosthecochloris ethylica]NUK46672.1 dihydrolipoyl dehydrogenase [Prosthecochloris ethylica]